MDLTHPSAHEQPEDPIKIQHPEEEEHHESGASKMFKRVKAKAKKIKNSLTNKHGNEHEQDVDEEDDDDDIDEQLKNVHNHPKASEPSGVTDQPLSHPRDTHIPIVPEETSDYSRPIVPESSKDTTYGHEAEPEPLKDVTYGHEAPSYPVSLTSDKEETVSDHVTMADVFVKEDSKEEADDVPVNNTSRLSEMEDLKRTFAPDEYQREVDVETPKRVEEDSRVAEIDESFSSLKVEDGSPHQESERDLPTRSNEFDMDTEPAKYGGGSVAELGDGVPIKSYEFDHKTETGIDKNSQAAFGSELGAAEVEEDFPTKSHEFEQKVVSGTNEDLPPGFGGESGAGKREEFLAKNLEFNQEIDSGIGQEPLTELPEDLPVKSHEVGVEKVFPGRSDDVEVESELGSHNDQYSSEFSRPQERDFDSSVEVTRDEAQEPEHTTYAEQTGSAPSGIAEKAIAAKDAVASKLGYPKESHVEVETPVTEHKVEDDVDEKFTPVDIDNVKDTGSIESTKLPLSGGGSGLSEDKDVSPVENVRVPGEEDKALWGKLKEEREQGEAAAEVEQGGGMVGKIKGAYNYFLGGTTEAAKPKSPTSVEESSQSLGSTAGTKGFPESGESGLGETDGGSVPVQKGL